MSASFEVVLRDYSDFLASQAALGLDVTEMRLAEVNSLVKQVAELASLDRAGATRISKALAGMAWAHAEQAALGSAIAECVRAEKPENSCAQVANLPRGRFVLNGVALESAR